MPRTEFNRRDFVLEVKDLSEVESALDSARRLPELVLEPNLLARLVLKLGSEELAAMPWETMLPVSDRVVVRASPVRPRFLRSPLKLPLRIFQLYPRQEHPLEQWVRETFGTHDQEAVDKAVVVASGDDPPKDWPVVDILHVDRFGDHSTELLMSLASTELAGTLGWFVRWTNIWQTRLVVLSCETAKEAEDGRRLAHALCARGGPGVVVADRANETFFSLFYQALIHDSPVDMAGKGQALFLGEEREEAVRVSNVAVSIADFEEQNRGRKKIGKSRGFGFISLDTADSFVGFGQKFHEWNFDVHEGDGLLPMASAVDELKAAVPPTLPWLDRTFPPAQAVAERYVNAAFWQSRSGDFTQMPGPLHPGAPCYLGVQIGDKDQAADVLDARALIEEDFAWTPEKEGVWVEIGVSGIDFDIEGSPVQELWLPRTGKSDTVYFTVIPREGVPVAKLRYGLYYRNNLIQSFRLAAYVQQGNDEAIPENVPEQMAEALSVPAERIGKSLCKSRLEYSRTSDFTRLEQKDAPAISITANQLLSQEIVTIKGPEDFHTAVYPDGEMKSIVRQIRSRIDEIGYGPADAQDRQFRFGKYSPDLQGRLTAALIDLADAGFRLYTNLAPKPQSRQAIAAALDGEGKVIHVAQLLREKVIPWGFVYDRAFDKRSEAPMACLAALPDAGSAMRATRCGTHPECLLHPSVQPPNSERSVACPLHFWGFQHVIEVPSQQVEDGDTPREEETCIPAKEKVRFAAGLNGTLATSTKHWAQLSEGRGWNDPLYSRDQILAQLRDAELDLIYFFCHARGGEMDPAKADPPYLEFQPQGVAAPQQILPQDFADDVLWAHRPLVFLNACGTLGYSPDALSPFLKMLVDGRGAAGVLGTEVPVAEAMAGAVACSFIARFLLGEKAGKALLEVRRELLGQKNPLGLVYTLFAPAALAVDIDGDGKCSQQ